MIGDEDVCWTDEAKAVMVDDAHYLAWQVRMARLLGRTYTRQWAARQLNLAASTRRLAQLG